MCIIQQWNNVLLQVRKVVQDTLKNVHPIYNIKVIHFMYAQLEQNKINSSFFMFRLP